MSAITGRIEGRRRDVGNVRVCRLLPYRGGRMIGPWAFFDHMGPVDFAPGQGLDVRPHPHIGLATVTYLFEGEIVHRDSLGKVQPIQPGAVNWMTAGAGIVHSERTDAGLRQRGHRLHGIQSWVALPEIDAEMSPSFEHVPADRVPMWEEGAATLRLLVGEAFGRVAPAPARSPMFYIHVESRGPSRVTVPAGHAERAVYVVRGTVMVEGEPVAPGTMVSVSSSAIPVIELGPDTTAMLLGGLPVGRRVIWWNFVALNQQRLERAKAEWRGGRFASIPGESDPMPLPEVQGTTLNR
jgi:redox-sensitive bicupin YhaK (pirin superfamily)